MPGKAKISVRDYSGEGSAMSFDTENVTSITFDAVATQVADFQAAMLAVTLGLIQVKYFGLAIDYSAAPSPDPAAAREVKWLVTYTDDGAPTRKLQMELPCADVDTATLRVANSDEADLTDPLWVTLIATLEAVVRAPYTGSTVKVIGIRLVGRNI